MITLTRTAKDIDFTGNGLLFNVKSTKAYSANGSCAELVLSFTHSLGAGVVFSFGFGEKLIQFTVVTTENDTGDEIVANSSVSQIVDKLKCNYLLQKYYTILYSGNVIILTAKEKGVYYSIGFLSNTQFISVLSNTPGTDKLLRSSFKTLSEVWLEKDRVNNVFGLVATSLHNVDVNGECNIMPGKLLSKYFADIDLPDYGQSAIKKVSKTVKKYYLKLAEMYEGGVKKVTVSPSLFAIDGKIDSDIFTDNFDYSTYAAVAKSYLLDAAVEKIETWATAQQFLYFVNYLASANISQKVKIYYTDGNDATVTKETITGSVKGECFIIPTGFNQLNLAAVTPAKEAYKYEVWLENSAALIGRVMTYYLLQKPLYGREFWYKNSKGGMEAVLCEKQTHKLDIKRSELLTDSGFSTDIDEINDSYECITGNKTMKEIEHLAEFISCKKVFLLQKSSVYEVAIEQGNYTLADEFEDLYNYKFKYRINKKYAVSTAPTVVVVTGGVVVVLPPRKVVTFKKTR